MNGEKVHQTSDSTGRNAPPHSMAIDKSQLLPNLVWRKCNKRQISNIRNMISGLVESETCHRFNLSIEIYEIIRRRRSLRRRRRRRCHSIHIYWLNNNGNNDTAHGSSLTNGNGYSKFEFLARHFCWLDDFSFFSLSFFAIDIFPSSIQCILYFIIWKREKANVIVFVCLLCVRFLRSVQTKVWKLMRFAAHRNAFDFQSENTRAHVSLLPTPSQWKCHQIEWRIFCSLAFLRLHKIKEQSSFFILFYYSVDNMNISSVERGKIKQ